MGRVKGSPSAAMLRKMEETKNSITAISRVSASIKANRSSRDCGAMLIVVPLLAVTSKAERKEDLSSLPENSRMPIAARASTAAMQDRMLPTLRMAVVGKLIWEGCQDVNAGSGGKNFKYDMLMSNYWVYDRLS